MPTPGADPPLFAGLSVHLLDSKNRLTVPARWRGAAGEHFFALPDPVKPAIGLLVESELRALSAAAKADPELGGPGRRAFFRHYFSRAEPCPLDPQGRIVLPAAFCESAGLHREVVMVGTGERIEVWSPEAWEAETLQGAAEFRAAAERLGL